MKIKQICVITTITLMLFCVLSACAGDDNGNSENSWEGPVVGDDFHADPIYGVFKNPDNDGYDTRIIGQLNYYGDTTPEELINALNWYTGLNFAVKVTYDELGTAVEWLPESTIFDTKAVTAVLYNDSGEQEEYKFDDNNALRRFMLDSLSETLSWHAWGLHYTMDGGKDLVLEGLTPVDEFALSVLKQPLSTATIGNTIIFGDYEWRVLDKADNKLLIITNNIVENRAYNSEYDGITWEQCTLRSYLNNEFYDKFGDAEKSLILETNVVNADNPSYGTSGGNDTIDKVFLLSIDEAKKYFKDDNDRALVDWWWLRSPGYYSDDAALVYDSGNANDSGDDVDREAVGVRPALWLDVGE